MNIKCHLEGNLSTLIKDTRYGYNDRKVDYPFMKSVTFEFPLL